MKFCMDLRKENGQSLVEFALVVPLFLMVVFFIMEFGWTAYQRHAFNSGFTYVSQNFKASDVGDAGDAENLTDRSNYDGGIVRNAVKDKMVENGVWGFAADRVSVSNAVVSFSNKKSEYSVPGMSAGSTNTAEKYTRYMTLTADIEYEVKPLTFMGNLFFQGSSHVKKKLQIVRVAQEQSRSE